ncbi:MAG: maleylpyruvate isomerase N-terminal domain-containing protein [Ilumatobacteraceae bacterium]
MTNSTTTHDLGALYGAARQRITALVSANGIDLDTMVPSTPAWRVRDVVAHLAGVTADAIAGNMEGAPGEAWTAAQVARGRDRTLTEVLAEWAQFGPMLEGFLSSPAGAPASAAVIDVHTHEADVRHALGLSFDVPSEFLEWSMERLRDLFHKAVSEAGLPPVSVKVADAELFRARLGRRTEAEVRAYDWSVDPTPYLDSFFLFGPTEHSIGEHL